MRTRGRIERIFSIKIVTLSEPIKTSHDQNRQGPLAVPALPGMTSSPRTHGFSMRSHNLDNVLASIAARVLPMSLGTPPAASEQRTGPTSTLPKEDYTHGKKTSLDGTARTMMCQKFD